MEKRLILNKNGFTLVESLFVLSLVSVMSLVLITNIVPIYHQKVIESFLDQFEKDMLLAQQYAIVHEEPVYILFNGDQLQYSLEMNELATPLLRRSYHPGILLEGGTLTNRVTYISNGSIQKSGAMYITYNNRTFKVIFYLGKGRIRIEEL